MAFYELIFSVHKHENWTTLSVGGMHALARAAQYLDSLAKIGEIPGVTEVHVFDTVTVTSDQLRALLEELGMNPSTVDSEKSYDVYLSEV